MNRFLIPILFALALPNAAEANWWGIYRSKAEAKRACEYWAKNGISFKQAFREGDPISYFLNKNSDGTYDMPYDKSGSLKVKELEIAYPVIYVRKCRHEMVTRQFLGVNVVDIKKLKKLNSYKLQKPIPYSNIPWIYDQHIKYFEY